MFSSLETFNVFFFIGLALIVLGVLFEEKLIEVEDKIFSKFTRKEEQHEALAEDKI